MVINSADSGREIPTNTPSAVSGMAPEWTRNLALWLAPGLIFGLIFGLLGACAYTGGIDQPVTIKVTWFSYLNGDDIRAACKPGSQDWYRLVYNGNYDEQIRSYEVVGGDAGGAYYKARVINGGGLDLTRLSLTDLQSPGRWTTSQDWLNDGQLSTLQEALGASGAFSPAPAGLRLPSEQFYWISGACRDGVFYFHAWLYPSPGFANLRFPNLLLGYDGTGLKVNPPRETPRLERTRRIIKGEGTSIHFDLDVVEYGLIGG